MAGDRCPARSEVGRGTGVVDVTDRNVRVTRSIGGRLYRDASSLVEWRHSDELAIDRKPHYAERRYRRVEVSHGDVERDLLTDHRRVRRQRRIDRRARG